MLRYEIPVFVNINQLHCKEKLKRSRGHVAWCANIPRTKLVAMATPKWANKKENSMLRKAAQSATLITGIKHQVDHIIPLRSDKVCGLHVAENMQIISRTENLKKRNHF